MYVLNMIILCFYIKIKVIFRVVEIFTYTSIRKFYHATLHSIPRAYKYFFTIGNFSARWPTQLWTL